MLSWFFYSIRKKGKKRSGNLFEKSTAIRSSFAIEEILRITLEIIDNDLFNCNACVREIWRITEMGKKDGGERKKLLSLIKINDLTIVEI